MPSINTPDGTFDVAEHGDGPPVMLLHSLGTSKRLWSAVAPSLAASYRVVMPDFLGHGDSGPPPHEFTIPDHAASLVRLADTMGIGRFAVAGTSLGGLVGLELAASFPDRVTALVANGSPGWHLESQRYARLHNFSRLVGDDGLPRDGIAPGGTVRPVDAAQQAERADDFRKTGRWFISSGWAIASYDLVPRLARIRCPTLILMGDGDFHMATCYVLVDGIAGAQLRVLTNAGHLTPYDDPDGVCREIRTFLDGIAKDRSGRGQEAVA